jgi:FkbH-like protein
MATLPGLRLVNRHRLDVMSPAGERRDVKADLHSGFPYRLPHASALAELLARLVHTRTPKKGLITDLDNTLWKGVVGDDGPDGVSWDLGHRSQPHALYQQMLASLAGAGVLVAAASKNDAGPVEAVFKRDDLVIRPQLVFPVETHWGPKSETVGRILRAWNVGAESVVFVDDNPLELAEVQGAFPEMECWLFPKDDEGVVGLLARLRDAFGKERVTEEDGLRLQSLKPGQAAAFQDVGQDGYDVFLRSSDAEITFHLDPDPLDPRALELVNKTNQFNLNGRRYSEAEWRSRRGEPGSFLLVAGYRDRFGALGKVAVLGGRRGPGVLVVDTWVMSCRAFSRRIEHRCLEQLFALFGVDEVELDYRPTPRNGPLREFLARLTDGGVVGSPMRVDRPSFEARCPPLHHRLRGTANARCD